MYSFILDENWHLGLQNFEIKAWKENTHICVSDLELDANLLVILLKGQKDCESINKSDYQGC